MSELENGFRLGDVIALLKRRSAFVLCAAVIGIVLGFVAFTTSPTNYSATTRVQVDPIPTGSATAPQTVDMATETEVVRSDDVAKRIRELLEPALDGESNRDVLTGVLPAFTPDSSVLSITVESTSPTRARDVANAAAKSYLARRRAGIQTTVDDLNRRRDELSQKIADLQASLEAETATNKAKIQSEINNTQAELDGYTSRVTLIGNVEEAGGSILKEAQLPDSVLSKMALAKGVGVFGVCVLIGLGVALLVDRRDSLGGGRRAIQQIAPQANLRMMPTATGRKVGPAEIDAAIDRLAVELVGGGGAAAHRQRARAVLVAGTSGEPPVAMAEELASSLTFAGIPSLFVLAGSSEREVRDAQIVTSFADLITGPSVTGPASLPSTAGSATAATASPTVTWLRPRGSAEASGLLRRAVIEALLSRAGREGFEAVVFVAATPTKNAAAAALGQWCDKVAVIVQGEDAPDVEAAVKALVEADVRIDEVVWT